MTSLPDADTRRIQSNDRTYTTLAVQLPADYYDEEIEGIETEPDGGVILYVV